MLLALAALLIAQAGAGLHALKHFGQPGDPLGLASHHAQSCLECASFAPLNGAHSGGTVVFAVAAVGGTVLAQAVPEPRVGQATHFPFRSRAPPR